MEELLTPLTSFKEQFTYVPEINNKESLAPYESVVICGMGGSAICVSLLTLLFPELPVTLHNSYGLPKKYNKENTLFILNSYSGNTEEILEGYERAKKDGAHIAVLTRGGILLEKAKVSHDTYVQIPESDLEPRFSIGYQLLGILTLLGEEEKSTILRKRIGLLSMDKVRLQGKELAEKFTGTYPVLYSSINFYPVAYLIKAAINEGAKLPAFVNIIPEANHNELQSFVTDETRNEATTFSFLFITSEYDHVRIQKRFSTMEALYSDRGFLGATLPANHTDILSIFEVILTGYYMATYMAIAKSVDPYQTPLIAEFKKRMTL